MAKSAPLRPSAASRLDARASSSASSVRVPGVTSRTTSRRTTDLAPRFLASAGSSICSHTATRMALADQLFQIGFGGMHRHAAHGDVFALMLAALGQGDVQRLRRLCCIREEKLVKIAHAVKQQIVRHAPL